MHTALQQCALAGQAGLRDGRVWHPVDLPEGYHTSSRGQSWASGGGGCVEGCPRDAAWSGVARSTGCHTSPSVGTIKSRAGGTRKAPPDPAPVRMGCHGSVLRPAGTA